MEDKRSKFGFQPENYKLLLAGLALNILGYILMIGGAAKDADEFNSSELFSSTRITLAPILIVIGFIIIFYAIMRKKKVSKD